MGVITEVRIRGVKGERCVVWLQWVVVVSLICLCRGFGHCI